MQKSKLWRFLLFLNPGSEAVCDFLLIVQIDNSLVRSVDYYLCLGCGICPLKATLTAQGKFGAYMDAM